MSTDRGLIGTSKSISRVLYLTTIYLGQVLPPNSRHHPGKRRASVILPIWVLLRIGFTGPRSLLHAGELLPRLSTLTKSIKLLAVYFCCTIPRVASGGRYPLSCPAELGLSSGAAFRHCIRGCLTYSR